MQYKRMRKSQCLPRHAAAASSYATWACVALTSMVCKNLTPLIAHVRGIAIRRALTPRAKTLTTASEFLGTLHAALVALRAVSSPERAPSLHLQFATVPWVQQCANQHRSHGSRVSSWGATPLRSLPLARPFSLMALTTTCPLSRLLLFRLKDHFICKHRRKEASHR